MEMSQLVIGGFFTFFLYLMIFHNEKFNAANKSGWDNVEKTGKMLGKGAKVGLTIFRLFRK